MKEMFTRDSERIVGNERGMVLVIAMMLIVVLVLLGATAVMTSTTDLKISSNYRDGVRAVYVAEGGLEEARARLRANAASPITDGQPTSADWRAYIGTSANAQGKGYNSGSHSLYSSLQSSLNYTVKISHKLDEHGNVMYWGDTDFDGVNQRNTGGIGRNIYLVTSYGFASNSGRQLIVELTKVPPVSAQAALYVQAPTIIQGNSTNVIGLDQCGGTNLPGVATTLATTTVTGKGGGKEGDPTVSGSTSATWSVVHATTSMDVQAMIDSLKGSANYVYNVASATITGMSWGTPTQGATLQNPSNCTETNIVYFNTWNGSNFTDIKLAGGSSPSGTKGCGTLIVEGDLDLNGGFSWYGVVLISGSVTYSGGGNKNITGAVIAGGSVEADLVGGNANIVYCSTALSRQTENQPLRRLSWLEKEKM